jgi:hypothetical protein
MTTSLIKGLSWAVVLFTLSGCEFVSFEAPVDMTPSSSEPGDGGATTGPAPLYPFRPGSIWQYDVTGLDGSKSRKFVAIDKVPVMVGGTGDHQNDMAYGVRTSAAPGGQASLVTMQAQVGNQIVNWREQQMDGFNQVTVDINWSPQQVEIDQSTEHTRVGASWQESYTELIRPTGLPIQTLNQNQVWKVVREEVLTLPMVATPFQTIVFQKTLATGGTPPSDAGSTVAGKVGDAGIGRPMLTGSDSPQADGDGGGDGGATMMPKTTWWSRGYGKVKEAGGGEPTEELSGLELH